MAKGKKQTFRSRSQILLAIILILGFGSAALRLGYLQIFKADELQSKAINQQLNPAVLPAKRGMIYDVNGKTLAESATVWRVVLAPVYLENDVQRRIVAEGLAEILDLEEEEVYEKTLKNSYYVEVKRQVEKDTREELLKFMDKIENVSKEEKEKKVSSNVIFLIEDYKRYYPSNYLASSVIGFMNADNEGIEGIEYQYNDVLKGTPGRLVTATDAAGTAMPFQYSQRVEAIDGSNVYLTIDETIQAIAEKYMEQAIVQYNVVNRGVCIIMDVNTGAIRAMASVGGFDLNDPRTLPQDVIEEIKKLPAENRGAAELEALRKIWRNKAVSDTYIPGSVFKMFTAAMALEEGLVTEESTFYCDGAYTVDGVTMHCHNRAGHGMQTFRECIKNSCNPAFMQIGELIGEERFWEYYQAFGFSELSGVDLPGEAHDDFFADFNSVELATASFGQNFQVTPIQVATAVCSIANGGYLVKPHVVDRIEDAEGNVQQVVSTEVKRQAISTETATLIADILEENAISGSGKNGYVPGYRVAGKTGTSEKMDDPAVKDDYIASFCGFAPAENANVVCLVFFDTPMGGAYYGSQVAAPVYAQIMSEVLPYMQVATQYTEEELAALDKTTGTYIGLSVEEAENVAESEGFTTSVKGEGDVVLAQVPSAGTSIPKGGNVVLYTDKESAQVKVEVPDMTGYTVYDMNYFASVYDINVSVSGVNDSSLTYSSTQSIPPGTMVPPGTVVKVNFTSGGIED